MVNGSAVATTLVPFVWHDVWCYFLSGSAKSCSAAVRPLITMMQEGRTTNMFDLPRAMVVDWGKLIAFLDWEAAVASGGRIKG